jgi:hypothetical protein
MFSLLFGAMLLMAGESGEEDGRGSPHLKYMSYYGFNPPLMHGWVNMGLEAGLDVKLAAWKKYQIPSFYGGLPAAHTAGCSDNPKAIFQRGEGAAKGLLCPNWEANFEDLAKTEILPNFGPGKALRGVFFGDEICVSTSGLSCAQSARNPNTLPGVLPDVRAT